MSAATVSVAIINSISKFLGYNSERFTQYRQGLIEGVYDLHQDMLRSGDTTRELKSRPYKDIIAEASIEMDNPDVIVIVICGKSGDLLGSSATHFYSVDFSNGLSGAKLAHSEIAIPRGEMTSVGVRKVYSLYLLELVLPR